MNNKKNAFPMVIVIMMFLEFLMRPMVSIAVSEQQATPEIWNEPGAKLLVTEVNLKNKTSDWVELYYESPTGKPFNLKNFGFRDDTVFKKIAADYWVSSGEYYVLKFKSSEPDSQTAHLLSTARTGLTATTEQIMIVNPSGEILDALCWANASPTADETEDMQELFENEGWVSANPSSCFSSAKISTNQSLIRVNMNDTDSANDWTVTDDLTAGKANNTGADGREDAPPQAAPTPGPSSLQPANGSETDATSPADKYPADPQAAINDTVRDIPAPDHLTAGDGEKIFDQLNQPASVPKPAPAQKSVKNTSSSSQKSSSKKTAPKYKNGDISADIIISEIYPRALEDDRSNEWIELANAGESDVNLGNWQLDDGEGGSKPYVLPDSLTVPAGGAVIIKASESKLSLANAKDMVRLFDPEGKLLQTVEYEEAPKNESYARIMINKKNGESEEEWLWVKEYTPGEPNPEYTELTGTITAAAEFGKTYSFKFMQSDHSEPEDQTNLTTEKSRNPELTVTFEEALIAGPLAKAAFQQGAAVKITGTFDPELPEVFHLVRYEITGSPPAADDGGSPWFWVGLLPPGGAGFWYGLKKLKKIYGKI